MPSLPSRKPADGPMTKSAIRRTRGRAIPRHMHPSYPAYQQKREDERATREAARDARDSETNAPPYHEEHNGVWYMWDSDAGRWRRSHPNQ